MAIPILGAAALLGLRFTRQKQERQRQWRQNLVAQGIARGDEFLTTEEGQKLLKDVAGKEGLPLANAALMANRVVGQVRQGATQALQAPVRERTQLAAPGQAPPGGLQNIQQVPPQTQAAIQQAQAAQPGQAPTGQQAPSTTFTPGVSPLVRPAEAARRTQPVVEREATDVEVAQRFRRLSPTLQATIAGPELAKISLESMKTNAALEQARAVTKREFGKEKVEIVNQVRQATQQLPLAERRQILQRARQAQNFDQLAQVMTEVPGDQLFTVTLGGHKVKLTTEQLIETKKSPTLASLAVEAAKGSDQARAALDIYASARRQPGVSVNVPEQTFRVDLDKDGNVTGIRTGAAAEGGPEIPQTVITQSINKIQAGQSTLRLIEEAEELIVNRPNVASAWGDLLLMGQNLRALIMGVARPDPDEPSDKVAAFLEQIPTADISQFQMLETLLAFRLALEGNPQGRISDADFNNAKDALKTEGTLKNAGDFLPRLRTFKKLIQGSVEDAQRMLALARDVEAKGTQGQERPAPTQEEFRRRLEQRLREGAQ